jgi:hypothetical protein
MEPDLIEHMTALSERLHNIADSAASEYNTVATLETLNSALEDAREVIKAVIWLHLFRAKLN